jgi:hypothetical protein
MGVCVSCERRSGSPAYRCGLSKTRLSEPKEERDNDPSVECVGVVYLYRLYTCSRTPPLYSGEPSMAAAPAKKKKVSRGSFG